MGFRSSSGRCVPSRHQAEGHPQVLIIALWTAIRDHPGNSHRGLYDLAPLAGRKVHNRIDAAVAALVREEQAGIMLLPRYGAHAYWLLTQDRAEAPAPVRPEWTEHLVNLDRAEVLRVMLADPEVIGILTSDITPPPLSLTTYCSFDRQACQRQR